MNQSTQINDILNRIANLPLDEQSYIADIVNHRVHEIQRNRLGDRVKEAELNYAPGQVVTGSIDDLFAALDND